MNQVNQFNKKCVELFSSGKNNYRKLDENNKYELIGAYIDENVDPWNVLEPITEQSTISIEKFSRMMIKCLEGRRTKESLAKCMMELYDEYFGDDVEDEFDRLAFYYQEDRKRIVINY